MRNRKNEVLPLLNTLETDNVTGFIDLQNARINSRLRTIPVVGVELGSTALHLAMCYSDITIVRLLLEHGASPDVETTTGLDCLMSAAS